MRKPVETSTRPMFFESVEDAAAEVVRCAGGPKVVACALWPDKAPDAAHRLLLACLNEHRQERLTPGQLLFLSRRGREVGCHALMEFLAVESGYRCEPVEPQDEFATLLDEASRLTRAQQAIAVRLEKLIEQAPRLKAVG